MIANPMVDEYRQVSCDNEKATCLLPKLDRQLFPGPSYVLILVSTCIVAWVLWGAQIPGRQPGALSFVIVQRGLSAASLSDCSNIEVVAVAFYIESDGKTRGLT